VGVFLLLLYKDDLTDIDKKEVSMTNIYAINNWNFNKEVSEEFDLHVRQSIPLYNEFQKLTVKIAEFFIRNNDIIYDLGCATGETAYLINKKK